MNILARTTKNEQRTNNNTLECERENPLGYTYVVVRDDMKLDGLNVKGGALDKWLDRHGDTDHDRPEDEDELELELLGVPLIALSRGRKNYFPPMERTFDVAGIMRWILVLSA